MEEVREGEDVVEIHYEGERRGRRKRRKRKKKNGESWSRREKKREEQEEIPREQTELSSHACGQLNVKPIVVIPRAHTLSGQ